jgi:triphosphatase
MGQEIEVKLEVPRKAIRKSAELPWLLRLACGPAKHKKLTSVYFDTPKRKLRDHGVALRVRHVGKMRLQTIKVIAKGGRGPLARDEWEEEIAGTDPDLRLAKDTALDALKLKKLRRKLRPVFETVVERVTLPVRIGRSEIEVAVDRGSIKAGRHHEAINELELELKRGDPVDLAQLAERFARSLPVAYGARPKQDRGYALVAGKPTGPVGASSIALDPHSSTAEAFRVIALACLDHALANERAVRAGDRESIHQMRVGLRRLRAALSLFRPLVDGAQTDGVKGELKWLTEQLAPARDLDVLIAEGVRPLQGDAPKAEFRTLVDDLENRRHKGFDRARVAVDSDRHRSLGLKTALWVINGEWTRNGDEMIAALRERPAVDFAAEIRNRGKSPGVRSG